jgi:hypothetical protein
LPLHTLDALCAHALGAGHHSCYRLHSLSLSLSHTVGEEDRWADWREPWSV